jgi:hypothetical protein
VIRLFRAFDCRAHFDSPLYVSFRISAAEATISHDRLNNRCKCRGKYGRIRGNRFS